MAKYNVENIKSVDEILDNNTNEDLGIQPMIFAPDEPRVTVTERVLNIPDELQTIGVENDNNVERIYFEIPRYFDEVNDLSEFNFYINYLNANQEPNQYHCTDVEVEGDNVVFSWLTSKNVYAYRGIVRFIVYAVATDNRKWNTTVAELNVLEGLETEGQIIDNNPDIINELINLQEQFEEALDTIEQQQSTIEAQQSTISSQQTTITNQQNKITEQQEQIDDSIEVMGDYEVVQDNPTQIRFKKGDGTYGDTVNLGDNLASKSMVNAGYDTYSGNSYSGSASDYGIEIGKASGNYEQVTTTGKNLFDINEINTIGSNLINNGNGSLTVKTNSSSSGVSSNVLLSEACPTLEVGKTYTLQANSTGSNKFIYLSGINVSLYFGSSFTVTQSHLDSMILFYASGTDTSATISDIQIELGSVSTDYEPFTGGEPSPSPDYAQEPKFFEPKHVNTNGGNLFDASKIPNKTHGGATVTNNHDGSFTISGNGNITTGNYDLRMDLTHEETIKLLKVGTLKCNFEIVSEPYFYILIVNKNGVIKEINGITTGLKTLDITQEYLNDDSFYLRYGFYGILNKPIKSGTIKPMVYQDGDGAWLPYNADSTPLDITLRALPNGVCDTYENRVITRRVGVYIADTIDSLQIQVSSGRKFFALTPENKKYQGGMTSFLCNKIQKTEADTQDDCIYQNPLNFVIVGTIDDTLETFKEKFLNTIVYYELAEPTTERVDLPVIPSYYPYTNAWHDSEVKASELTWFINTYARNNEYTDEFLQKFFALQRTGKVYTVKFPLWNTSQSPVGEKLHHNVGLTCTPSTDTVVGQDDYESIPLFKTYDVNAYVDDSGKIHVTAFKGDNNFNDIGKVDVFVLGMSYYERFWEENGYWYYSRTDSPKDGYKIARECVGNDGRIMPYALYSKYVSGEIDGTLYSSKGLKPRRNMSYNVSESEYHKRGKYYGGGKTSLYKYLLTTFYLKYATLNTQSVMQGTSNYNYQYACVQAENNVKRVVLTTVQANNFVVGSYVSIGEKGSNSSVDRGNSYMHNIADSVKILSIESISDSNSAINVDVEEPFDTTTTTYISTMHWCSGFSDDVLGRDGSPSSLTDAKHPMVLQGIETMVGGYEVMGNAIMDITSSTGTRKPYIINDNSKIIQSVVNIKSTYETSNDIQPTTLSAWNYITEMKLDIENGYFGITKAGVSGSGSAVGFCDGLYVDSGTSGQREFLAVGSLWSGSSDGLSYLLASASLSHAIWHILSRLSI